MNRRIKGILALLLSLCMIFSLSGCKTVDKMREAQIFWEDASHTAVLYKGERYIATETGSNQILRHGYNSGRITDGDVPVLLSDILGEFACITKINGVTIIYKTYYDFDAEPSDGIMYCKPEYSEMITRESNSEYNKVAFSLWNYDKNYNPEFTFLILTDEEAKLMADLGESVTVADGAVIDSVGAVYECTESGCFGKETGMSILLDTVSGNYYFTMWDGEKFYSVPSEITEKYLGKYTNSFVKTEF